MFIGHIGIAFAAKRLAPKASLGALFGAALFADILWPIFILLGLEHVVVEPGITAVSPLKFTHYPYSHSLLMACVWAGAFSTAYWLLKRYQRGAAVLFLVVLSHWALDYISHRPDLPIYPGGTALVGLGLWNSVIGTIVFEGGLFILGAAIYWAFTESSDKTGAVSFWALIVFLVIAYAGNIFGPPPPDDPEKIAVFSLMSVLFIPWAHWIDRHRKPSG